MKLTTNSIAATFAALLIGGLAISPASAAVRNEISHFDVKGYVLNLELNGDIDRKNDPPFNTDHVAPDGEARVASKSQSDGKAYGSR